ncbi:MAG: AzlD domain-containing protein [Desulfobacterales bacterium]|nr:AzlD domain-containing protein [Desulfobacterales bacterium]
MNEICLISGMALVTFLIRYIMFPLSDKIEFPDAMARALRYAPPAVLTAIIVPAVLTPSGAEIQLSLQNAYLVGALGACVVGWFSRNLLMTIVFGMVIFPGWRQLLATGMI